MTETQANNVTDADTSFTEKDVTRLHDGLADYARQAGITIVGANDAGWKGAVKQYMKESQGLDLDIETGRVTRGSQAVGEVTEWELNPRERQASFKFRPHAFGSAIRMSTSV